MQRAERLGCALFLPLDLVAAEAFDASAAHQVVGLEEIPPGYMVLDFGPRSIAALKRDLADCRTVIWNGPLGAFELPPFATATFTLLENLAARSRAGEVTSVLGGGDTVAALNQTGLADDMSYVSTAGGAFLEWMEGKALPGLVALAQNRPA
jgi:phosphoglycerate kinase